MPVNIDLLDMPADQIFREKNWQDTFNRKGYVILEGLSREELNDTRQATQELLRDIRKKAPKRYFPVGQLMDFELRNRSTRIIEAVLPKILERHFRLDKISYYSGTHLIKPRGKGSFLATHQDSSLVDETRFHSILMWCPLQDTHWLNGRLFVLEGSHRFGNLHRSTTIPWAFKEVTSLIYKYSIPVPVKAGQVCYFHSALIHHSGYNFIQPYRIALSSLITSKGAPLLNYFQDQYTPQDQVEVYEADMEFFHNHDFNQRPSGYRCLGMVERKLPVLKDSEMMKLLPEIESI